MLDRLRHFSLPGCLLLAGGCELAEVTISEPQDLLVAEVFLRVAEAEASAFAFVYRSAGASTEPLPPSVVTLTRDDGEQRTLVEGHASECLKPDSPRPAVFRCHVLRPGTALGFLHPLATFHATVELTDGRRLEGGTTVPGAFDLLVPDGGVGTCALPEDTRLDLAWSPAAGSWAYLAETEIRGLREALEPRGIEVPGEPVRLQGVSVSQEDTDIAFPAGFGLFDRFGDGRDLLLAIQNGLPYGASARIVITAAERNTVNWVRGGDFNPSGPVRVPSLFGDGTGVVGASVHRSVEVVVGDPGSGTAPCAGQGAVAGSQPSMP